MQYTPEDQSPTFTSVPFVIVPRITHSHLRHPNSFQCGPTMSSQPRLTLQVTSSWANTVRIIYSSPSLHSTNGNILVKIPPRVMFLTQVWGTIIGVFVNYAVMASIVAARREVLLDPVGTNVWSGVTVQVCIICPPSSCTHNTNHGLSSES